MPVLQDPYVLKDPEHLADLMKQNNHSYRTLARATGYGKSPLHKLRNGKQKTISYSHAERIAEALNVPVTVLFRPKRLPEGD